jgi:hypothetical protein
MFGNRKKTSTYVYDLTCTYSRHSRLLAGKPMAWVRGTQKLFGGKTERLSAGKTQQLSARKHNYWRKKHSSNSGKNTTV